MFFIINFEVHLLLFQDPITPYGSQTSADGLSSGSPTFQLTLMLLAQVIKRGGQHFTAMLYCFSTDRAQSYHSPQVRRS
jgi:hypothetical protein